MSSVTTNKNAQPLAVEPKTPPEPAVITVAVDGMSGPGDLYIRRGKVLEPNDILARRTLAERGLNLRKRSLESGIARLRIPEVNAAVIELEQAKVAHARQTVTEQEARVAAFQELESFDVSLTM